MLKMEDVEVEYTSRTADQEVDVVEICPQHPDFMIIATYSLLKKDDPSDYEGQTRRGTIQVMPVSSTFKPKYAGMLPPQLDRVAFSCAVLDIHFHPSDGSLLGVATSNAEMHFFRFIKHGDVLGRRVITRLLPLGMATVAENDEFGLVPLVTNFTWFPDIRPHGVSEISDVHDISFALTTSFGDTKVVKTSIPAIKDLFDARLDQTREALAFNSTDIHKHDLEAWTAAVVPLRLSSDDDVTTTTTTSSEYDMILSGGDDSALIASAIDHAAITPSTPTSPSDTPSVTAMPLWRDRRSHTAGVVAILPLPRRAVRNDNGLEPTREIIPLVTGSYDEFLRVYEIDAKTYRATFRTDLRLNGGVWRLKVLDQYDTTTTNITTDGTDGTSTTTERKDPDPEAAAPSLPTGSATTNTDQSQIQVQHQHHDILILASLMHAGAAIIRLRYTPHSATWTITREASFRAGHESMVYCCDAIADAPSTTTSTTTDNDGAVVGKEEPFASAEAVAQGYTIVSTSFYDMKICTWRFVDQEKKNKAQTPSSS